MVNQKIGKMINICTDSMVRWNVDNLSDGLWTVRASCPHGNFVSQSDSVADLETAFGRMLTSFRNAHGEPIPPVPSD